MPTQSIRMEIVDQVAAADNEYAVFAQWRELLPSSKWNDADLLSSMFSWTTRRSLWLRTRLLRRLKTLYIVEC